eukprot:11189590-Lingulodinium_polyedra.AAC.1
MENDSATVAVEVRPRVDALPQVGDVRAEARAEVRLLESGLEPADAIRPVAGTRRPDLHADRLRSTGCKSVGQ